MLKVPSTVEVCIYSFLKEAMDKENIFVKSYLLIKSYFNAIGKIFHYKDYAIKHC